jgi:hypothetical protein
MKSRSKKVLGGFGVVLLIYLAAYFSSVRINYIASKAVDISRARVSAV